MPCDIIYIICATKTNKQTNTEKKKTTHKYGQQAGSCGGGGLREISEGD